ncbi:carbohydrate ABC transporter membrane protein 1 (CUT1 family) [Hypnocyclicus thermotrophus]|uniref:Carbohydrate ABC transporter membrane protein 1 (CUT1 family) n=1 Tax=Hypnocyclicus thermotrophus TaxID=1627895 RepID=A0AA46DYH1_9FUSO|nr:ABC transporter permease subunit [Hypnocyclicus thermotrophus]TDT70459.1 carbohydrate ABC transporter membrane protein 1 (CUT1 family) [Hypnocyclicus thermotrophus]
MEQPGSLKRKENFNEKLKKTWKLIKRQKYLHLMVIPGIIWMIIFNYIPMYGIIIAFKNYTIIDTFNSAPWVGLENFKEFFMDDNFFLVMKNTLGISVLKLIIGFPLPIAFAIMLNELYNSKLKKYVQTISYLPHFFSWVVLGGIMINWLSQTGLMNKVLMGVGIIQEPIVFLAHPKYFWGISIISDIWKELGWNAIIYLAAIAGINPTLYEAAKIDGAGKMAQIWHITLPSIKGTITILFILAVSGILNTNFEQMLVLQNPLNLSASEVIDTFVYKMGLQSLRFSYATAVGLFKSVIAFILLVSANYTSKKINGKALF